MLNREISTMLGTLQDNVSRIFDKLDLEKPLRRDGFRHWQTAVASR